MIPVVSNTPTFSDSDNSNQCSDFFTRVKRDMSVAQDKNLIGSSSSNPPFDASTVKNENDFSQHETTLRNAFQQSFFNPNKSESTEYSTHARNFRACRLRNKASSAMFYEGKSDSETTEGISSGISVVTESDESSNLVDSDDTEVQGNGRRHLKNKLTKPNNSLKTKKKVTTSHNSKYKTSNTFGGEHLTTAWTPRLSNGNRKKDLRKNDASHLDSDASSYVEFGRRQRSRVTTQKKQLLPPLRASTRHATISQPNFSQLLQSSSSSSSSSFSDDDNASTFVESSTVVQNVEKVLGYRFLNESEKTEVCVMPWSVNNEKETVLDDLEFLIKWNDKSHLHNTWCTYQSLVNTHCGGLRKVEIFFRKMQYLSQQLPHMTNDEIECQNITLEFQRQIDLDSLIAERIISHRVEYRTRTIPSNFITKTTPCKTSLSPIDLQETHLNEIDKVNDASLDTSLPDSLVCVSSEQHEPQDASLDANNNETNKQTASVQFQKLSTDMYYVKWTNSQYDQCTWETGDVLREHGFASVIEEFYKLQSRISGSASAFLPLHRHSLCRTSFQPYTTTPFYLNQSHGKDLRDYQLTGLNWMVSRMKKGYSVLLADEMGLGKTVQTISVIGHIMFSELIVGPFLIIVPQSTADNWLSEFRQWLPTANVIVYHGNPVSRAIIQEFEMDRVQAWPYVASRNTENTVGSRILAGSNRWRYRFDVCICTFSILNNTEQLEFLRRFEWYLIAIDEAHLLKNRKSRRFRELKCFKSQYRILLSGTPLHNNLEELWSLLHFLSPRVYENLETFKGRFSEIEQNDSVGIIKEKQLEMLQSELHELVLRRVKKDVEKSLPRKLERILRVELSPQQMQCSKAILSRNYEILARSTGTSKASLQNICMELKKACNHPLLLRSDFDIATLQSNASISPSYREEWYNALLNTSGKIALLDKLLPYLKERNHRVLIFSQMVRMLNILSMYLTLRGFKHQRLDGTRSREVRRKAIDHFNHPDSDDFCFLLSTRAGGLGINLTSADTVIIYDSDWNPQNDLQAEARAHRIGQTKTVQIYRLVTKDTIEERILERAKCKMVLDTLVVQGLNKREDRAIFDDTQMKNDNKTLPSQQSGFSREELNRILKFGASKLWKPSTLNKKPITQPSILIEYWQKQKKQITKALQINYCQVSQIYLTFISQRPMSRQNVMVHGKV
ncbi:uncharacterized protein LOC128884386 isoform X2 [Hylaeus volcanicus]|uniref:uncharacterized protein LOC128884386 isoform X2 n=1 Tax=Hylaeus volcanicus TaxID=313075 RepID=UPI0023B7893C|nr:uncharacterized protein LOC128884386 isoform X2 [Hylaeus volcanicus]